MDIFEQVAWAVIFSKTSLLKSYENDVYVLKTILIPSAAWEIFYAVAIK